MQRWWIVYWKGKKIDEVPCSPIDTAEDVRRSLIEHDGYPGGIEAKPWSPARSREKLYRLRRK